MTAARGTGVIGIGIDVCDVARLEAALERTPGLAERLFTAGERSVGTTERLAARFAAKEAAAKALRTPGAGRWHDAEVVHDAVGAPELRVTGLAAARAGDLGGTAWHVSLSHDGGIATAMVVLSA